MDFFRVSPAYLREVAEFNEIPLRQAAALVFLTWLLARRRLTEWLT